VSRRRNVGCGVLSRAVCLRADTLDPARIVSYPGAMAEELSKRMDDVHRRLDDLRGDMDRRFEDLKSAMNQRFTAADQRFTAVDQRFTAVDQRFDRVDTELLEVRAELRELRADIRSHFRWTVTTMVALFGAAVPVWMWVLGLILRIR
jgi:hypothetical protein